MDIAITTFKCSDSFTRVVPTVSKLIGYGVWLYFLTKTMRTVATGVAYASWSGFGIVLTTIAAYSIHGQKIERMARRR